MRRRELLQCLGLASASALLPRVAWGAAPEADFFIFIHASGGWDVTLWADPRNEAKGLVAPASTENTDIAPLTRWKSAPLDGTTSTFEILAPSDTALRLGPALGNLYEHRQRLTIVNGLEMSTVSHPDGTAYSITGHHLRGGRMGHPSCDVILAHERGTSQLIPSIAISYPTSFAGALDRRAVPLRLSNASTFARSLARSDAYLTANDRDAISLVLTAEARELVTRADFPEPYEQLVSQLDAQSHLTAADVRSAFEAGALQKRYPMFDYKTKSFGNAMLGPAFALEAMQRNLVRCVGFSLGGLDTHNDNYRRHATILQDLFNTLATLLVQLDATPHPTLASTRLSERTHIFVFSDFCRTPQITVTGGRDHYPNNSALIISPRFRGGRAFGATDPEQLLPITPTPRASRPLSPPDVLATFLHAAGVDPRPYLREGVIQRDMLV